ncbi:MAG: YoaK family protein [Pseudomonadota bacterium]
MPINYSRRLTGKERSSGANRHLGLALAFVAGAINAGGFLAVRQYTSHMTGIVSSMADSLALGTFALALAGLGALLSFVCGAAVSAILVNYSRQHQLHSEYALPLMLEAVLLLCFGLLGARLADIDGLFVSVTVMLLAFIMGLQNAVVSKLSHAEIRTTHVTGIVTDIGIELGKALYCNSDQFHGRARVSVNRARLQLLASLLLFFFIGGIAGALGFKHVGYGATVPLALVLVALASVPIADDVAQLLRRTRS